MNNKYDYSSIGKLYNLFTFVQMSNTNFTTILDKWLDGSIELAPITKLLNIKPIEFSDRKAKVEMMALKEHHNAIGILHGGLVCALADVAIGAALAPSLNNNESFTTMELSTNYFSPVVESRLKATAELIHRGRRSAYLEC